jgi:hypothetical protein
MEVKHPSVFIFMFAWKQLHNLHGPISSLIRNRIQRGIEDSLSLWCVNQSPGYFNLYSLSIILFSLSEVLLFSLK